MESPEGEVSHVEPPYFQPHLVENRSLAYQALQYGFLRSEDINDDRPLEFTSLAEAIRFVMERFSQAEEKRRIDSEPIPNSSEYAESAGDGETPFRDEFRRILIEGYKLLR